MKCWQHLMICCFQKWSFVSWERIGFRLQCVLLHLRFSLRTRVVSGVRKACRLRQKLKWAQSVMVNVNGFVFEVFPWSKALLQGKTSNTKPFTFTITDCAHFSFCRRRQALRTPETTRVRSENRRCKRTHWRRNPILSQETNDHFWKQQIIRCCQHFIIRPV